MLDKEGKPLILIVDDNILNRQRLENILINEGYKVAVAENGKQLLAFVNKKIPHLILMATVLRGMDGIEICNILKNDLKTRDIPIIFLSVHKNISEINAAFKAGGVDYIEWPFYREEVLGRVKVHLDQLEIRQRLKKAIEVLKKKVQQCTNELIESNNKLKEINIALKVLLEKKEEQAEEYKKNFVYNIKYCLEPYIQQLKQTELSLEQKVLVDLVEKKLSESVYPYLKELSEKYFLTPTEIQVADLIKSGKQTKEIAEILGLSKRTVDTHRHNIRRKLGIIKKNINLRSYLISLEED